MVGWSRNSSAGRKKFLSRYLCSGMLTCNRQIMYTIVQQSVPDFMTYDLLLQTKTNLSGLCLNIYQMVTLLFIWSSTSCLHRTTDMVRKILVLLLVMIKKKKLWFQKITQVTVKLSKAFLEILWNCSLTQKLYFSISLKPINKVS